MLLDLVPAEAKFFTCLDLKDALSASSWPHRSSLFFLPVGNPNTGKKGQVSGI
jgi:hypothetical protein